MLEYNKGKLFVLGIRGIPASHGGFETFAERLVIFLRDTGWDVTVLCQGSPSREKEEDDWNGIHRVHIPVLSKGSLGTIEFDIKSTWYVKGKKGLILTLGYNTGFLSSVLKMQGRTNFINMDGLEWKRDKYGVLARTYLWVNERLAAHAGTRLIADHPVIADHLSTRVSRDKIYTIPYGGDAIFDANESLLQKFGIQAGKFFTVIARPVPENTILEIVQAFSARKRGVNLVILGKYSHEDKYTSSVLNAASDEVVFLGAIYDKNALATLRFYSLAYIHGHTVGGTNPSLVEALGAGNAVIAHDNPFNRWVAGKGGIYFNNTESCDDAINSLICDIELKEKLQCQSRIRWEKEFTWENILSQYEIMLSSAL